MYDLPLHVLTVVQWQILPTPHFDRGLKFY